MKSLIKKMLSTCFLMTLALGLAGGCEEEGPLEEAAEETEQGIEEAGEEVEDMTE